MAPWTTAFVAAAAAAAVVATSATPILPSRVPENDPAYRAMVHTRPEERAKVEARLAELGIDDVKPRSADELEIFVTREQLRTVHKLRDETQVRVKVVEAAQPLRQKLERMRRAGGHVPPADRTANKRLVPDGYLDLQGVNDYLDEVARQYPDLAMRVDSRDFEPGLTYEGRSLPLLKLSRNVTADEDEPVYLLNGAHHAREIVTPHLVMDAVRRLTEGYGTDAGLTEVLDTRAIIVAPVWNPDGYEYVWNANNMWRKNRKPVGNTYGVDQNRNYPFGWDNSCSGSSVPSSETYKGPSPASEEETLTMIELQARYNVAKLLDYHSYGREVLIGFNCEPTPALLESFLTDEANELADLANYATRPPSGDGQNQGWALAAHTTYSFLVETQTEFQPDFDEAEAEAERVWPLTRAWLERPIPLRGHITAGGEPVAATINIREFNNELFTYRSDAAYGSYHIILPNGNYTLDVAASGLGTRAVQVSIDNSNPKTVDIQL